MKSYTCVVICICACFVLPALGFTASSPFTGSTRNRASSNLQEQRPRDAWAASSRQAASVCMAKNKKASEPKAAAADAPPSADKANGAETEQQEAAIEEPTPDPNAELKAKVKELEAAVRTAEQRHAAAQESIREKGKTGYLRLAAEVDNYRKRRSLDRNDLQREAVVKALKSFVPVMESFESAEAQLQLETENEKKFSGNFQALYRQLMEVCRKMGMTDFFGVKGEIFNPSRHERVSEQQSDQKEGTLLECIDKGLEISGSVVRKAKVVVSTGPEKAAAAADTATAPADAAADDAIDTAAE